MLLLKLSDWCLRHKLKLSCFSCINVTCCCSQDLNEIILFLVDDKRNPLSPNSDKNEISLYIIKTCSKIQVMRIKKVITKDQCLFYLIIIIIMIIIIIIFIISIVHFP